MLLAPYDAIFFKEPHVVNNLRATLDLPVYYLPECCNPRWHRPTVRAGTEPYLVIAGNMYASRSERNSTTALRRRFSSLARGDTHSRGARRPLHHAR